MGTIDLGQCLKREEKEMDQSEMVILAILPHQEHPSPPKVTSQTDKLAKDPFRMQHERCRHMQSNQYENKIVFNVIIQKINHYSFIFVKISIFYDIIKLYRSVQNSRIAVHHYI